MPRNSRADGPGEKGSKLWMQAIVNPDEKDLLSKLNSKMEIDSKILNAYKKEIQEKLCLDGGGWKWVSPLVNDEKIYHEYQLNEQNDIIKEFLGVDNSNIFSFWTSQHPVWDAIALSENKTEKKMFLFEAKAYTKEAEKPCGSKLLYNKKYEDVNIIIDDILFKKNTYNDEIETKYDSRGGKNIKAIIHALFEAYSYYTDEKNKSVLMKAMTLWITKYYQLGNRLTFLYNMNKNLKNIQTTLVLLNVVNDKTNIPTPEKAWKTYYATVFEELIGCSQPPNNVKVLLVNGSKGIELLWN